MRVGLMIRSLPYFGLLLLATAHANGQSIRVNPPRLQFVASFQGDAADPQSIAITPSNPTADLRVTITVEGEAPGSTPGDWMRIVGVPTRASVSRSTPTRLVVATDPGALAAGAYRARILISSPAASPSTVVVPIEFTVEPATPRLDVAPSFMRFVSRPGGDPQVDGLLVRNERGGGGLPVRFALVTPANWLTVSAVRTVTAPNRPVPVRVSVNPAGLRPGFYRTVLRFDPAAGQEPVDIPISLLVLADERILATQPSGLQFDMRQGFGTTLTRAVSILTAGTGTAQWRAEIVQGAAWLQISPATGSASAAQRGSLTVSVYSRDLAAAQYYGLIRITAPQYPTRFVTVSLDVDSAAANARPAPNPPGLLFVTTAGSPLVTQRAKVFTSARFALNYQVGTATADNRSWLYWISAGATQTASTDAPGDIEVGVDASSLGPGVYTGELNVTLSNEEVRSLNVTAVVAPAGTVLSAKGDRAAAGCTPSQLASVQTALVSNFTTPAAWPVPLTVKVVDNCGDAVTSAQVVANFSNGDPPLPLRHVGNGSYATTWAPGRVASQLAVTVRASTPALGDTTSTINGSVAVSRAPVLSPGGIINNFSGLVGSALAPGTVAAIFGSDLAALSASATQVPLPLSLNGTAVLVAGTPAPLYFASPAQVNLQLPIDLAAGGQHQVIVSANGALSLPEAIDVAPAAPGLLSTPTLVIAQRPDGSFVSPAAPARAGEILVLYLVGMGDTDPSPTTGAISPPVLARTKVTVDTLIGGRTSVVQFAGLTPGFVGLYQVNFVVPDGLGPGDHDIVVEQGGVRSNIGRLPVVP
ncbi:MAG: BACON domain-containing protein [Bryobacteraceae bacterium]